jgi:hypothetical protein
MITYRADTIGLKTQEFDVIAEASAALAYPGTVVYFNTQALSDLQSTGDYLDSEGPTMLKVTAVPAVSGTNHVDVRSDAVLGVTLTEALAGEKVKVRIVGKVDIATSKAAAITVGKKIGVSGTGAILGLAQIAVSGERTFGTLLEADAGTSVVTVQTAPRLQAYFNGFGTGIQK